jgi:hypothetical protein
MTVVNPVQAVSSSQTTTSQAVTFTGGGTFSGSVSLSVSGLPSYLTASWSSSTVTLNSAKTGTSTLTVTAGSSTSNGVVSTVKPGTYTATIKAVGSGLTVTKTVTVQVEGVTVTPSTTALTIHRGSKVVMTVTNSPAGGASGIAAVSLVPIGSASGITVASTTGALAAPGAGTKTFTLSAASTAALGTYRFNVVSQMQASTASSVFCVGTATTPVTVTVLQ